VYRFIFLVGLCSGLCLPGWSAPAGAAQQLEPASSITRRSEGVLEFTVQSRTPLPSKAAAREKVIDEVNRLLVEHFHQREEQLPYLPGREFVKSRLKWTKETYTEFDLGSSSIGVCYNIDATLLLPADIEQQFRKAGRITSALWGLGCAVAGLIVVGLFFRLDEWTKGYLTSLLVLLAALGLGGLAVLWFVYGMSPT
jgi:hypothetical protein